MRKLFVLYICLVVLCGCAGLQQKPSVCEQPEAEGSVICKILYDTGLATPEQANFVLKMAAGAVLENNMDECEKALAFVDTALILVDHGITYSTLAKYIDVDIPAALEITAQEILDGMLAVELPINDFDKGLLKTHFTQMRDVIFRVCTGQEAGE